MRDGTGIVIPRTRAAVLTESETIADTHTLTHAGAGTEPDAWSGAIAPAIVEPLASIATTSRDLVDAMSDIVWPSPIRAQESSRLGRRQR